MPLDRQDTGTQMARLLVVIVCYASDGLAVNCFFEQAHLENIVCNILLARRMADACSMHRMRQHLRLLIALSTSAILMPD